MARLAPRVSAPWLAALAVWATLACAGRQEPTISGPAGSEATAVPAPREPAPEAGEPQEKASESPEDPRENEAPPSRAGSEDQGSGEGAEAPATAPAAPEAAEAEEEKGPELPLRELCRGVGRSDQRTLVDRTREGLAQTVCSATLWFDGLFGGIPDVENARAVSGRLELGGLYSEYDGFDENIKLRLRYDLPTLENRLELFFGRDDAQDVAQDREESFAVRSSLFDLDRDEDWLGGLGYKPPGKWSQDFDFKLGGKLSSAPEIYIQGRYQKNIFVGENTAWRLRETLFLENREGFGSTTRLELDHILRHNLLGRWSNIGTISEETDGLEWRSTLLLYHRLVERSALGYEAFLSGATDRDVKIREFGLRTVFRRPIFRTWLFSEVIFGLTWPREFPDEPREPSGVFGIGIEMLFGQDPY